MARIAEARADGKKDSVLKADKAVAERLRHAGLAPDIALFGRMLAEKPEMNVEAACQVAHAISTHRVNPEMDFFTAVDDLKSASEAEEDAGAGMLGVTGYNSACFYRYSLVDLRHLSDHLKDPKVAMDVTGAFLRGSVFAIPTGKQTSMAAQNLPSFGMFVVRDSGAPCSLANAFAAPVNVRRDDEDLIGLSIRALANQWDEMATVYGTQGVLATALFCLPAYEERLGALAGSNCGSVDGAVAAVMAAVRG
jgi:CRISPR system Cascade subunit CasC